MSAAADSLRPASLSSTPVPTSTTTPTGTRAILPGRKITVYDGGKPPIGTLAKVFEVAAQKFQSASDKDFIFSSDLSSRKITQIEAGELADKAVEMCKKNKGLTGHLLSAVGTYAKENIKMLIDALQAKGLIAKKEDKSSPVIQRLSELYGDDKGVTAIREGYLVIENVGVDRDDEDEDEEESHDGSRPASPRISPVMDEHSSRVLVNPPPSPRLGAHPLSPSLHAAPQADVERGRLNLPPLQVQDESRPYFEGFEDESPVRSRPASTSHCHVQVVEDEEESPRLSSSSPRHHHVHHVAPQEKEARVVRSPSPAVMSFSQQSARPEDLQANPSQAALPTYYSYSNDTSLDTPQAAESVSFVAREAVQDPTAMRPRNDEEENHMLSFAAANGMSSASVTPLYRLPGEAEYNSLLAEEARQRSMLTERHTQYYW